jgi:hypothetical protein
MKEKRGKKRKKSEKEKKRRNIKTLPYYIIDA